MGRRRHGPVGSHYNSRRYHAMHKRNISDGLKRYHRLRKGHYTEADRRDAIGSLVVIAIVLAGIFVPYLWTAWK